MEYLTPIIVATIAAIGGYLGNKMSHKSKKTENKNTEMDTVLKNYQAMYDRLNEENKELRDRLRQVKEDNEVERSRLVQTISENNKQIEDLKLRISFLKEELEKLNREG